MFAGIYRDFVGKLECGDFKFTRIACIHAIPVIFYIYALSSFFKFPYNFCGDFRCNYMIITCTLQGMFCDTGIPCTFYGGKICSVLSQ